LGSMQAMTREVNYVTGLFERGPDLVDGGPIT
jgi:hypothetical protein